jgi:hypothetical protein
MVKKKSTRSRAAMRKRMMRNGRKFFKRGAEREARLMKRRKGTRATSDMSYATSVGAVPCGRAADGIDGTECCSRRSA